MIEQTILEREMEVGGRQLKLQLGKVAKQAGGAILARYGDTVVLATATMAQEIREGIDFFPLTVDYEERLYAVGKIPGGFIKREGRPSEKATLSARLIDRPIRPLFPKDFRNEVHIVITVLSVDQDSTPETVAMIAASAALHVSEIPFGGPIGCVVTGFVDGEYIINPTLEQTRRNLMHLAVAGTADAVMMVEAGAKEVSEDVVLGGISFGHEKIKEIVGFVNAFREEALALGLAKPKFEHIPPEINPEVEQALAQIAAGEKIKEVAARCCAEKLLKKDREKAFEDVKKQLMQDVLENFPEEAKNIKNILDDIEKKTIRRLVTGQKIRIDGRALDEVRPITIDVGLLPRTHGSALFTRGQTQILSVVTLGPISDEQILDGLGADESKRFMHHYNFPPFSVGETRPMRGPGRREIGHGALAERALEAVIPQEEVFPYTIRIVSEALESNGSTSMGSVCGSCLSLMDAGVPIKAPVAGVAMGLIKDEQIAILTDIQGIEDHLGDMDFKVAGTAAGVTAVQMDIKIHGVTKEILASALAQARDGRMHILNKMLGVISSSRKELSPYAPRIIHTVIDPDKIRDVIGPGGKIIKKIIEETNAEIDIEDDGRVFIASVDPKGGQRALEIIESLTKEVAVNSIYSGKVTRVTDFGCFVEVVPGVLGLSGKEGLVHISQLAHQRVNKVEDVVKEGDTILVKVLGYDNQGRMKLSRKDALPADQNQNKDHGTETGIPRRRPTPAKQTARYK